MPGGAWSRLDRRRKRVLSIAQQFNPGGGFKYLPSGTSPQAYASTDGLRAVAGGGFTSAPPVPTTTGALLWVSKGSFTVGTATKLALTVGDGAGDLKVCSVALALTGTTTTLGAFLVRPRPRPPTGCVTSLTPASGTGTVTAVMGKANSGSNTWKVSVDGTSFATTRGKVINVGDTIALRWGA